MSTETRVNESIASMTLLLAFEVSERTWKLGFSTGLGQRPRIRAVIAGDLGRLTEEIARAKQRFGLAAVTPVIRCYEAGRDRLCLHRYLDTHGVRIRIDRGFVEALETVRLWEGTPLPPGVRDRLCREWTHLQGVEAQRRELLGARARPLDTRSVSGRIREQLQTVRAIGPSGALVLATEIFAWRQIRNRRDR